MSKSIVVTGMGAVTPLGANFPTSWPRAYRRPGCPGSADPFRHPWAAAAVTPPAPNSPSPPRRAGQENQPPRAGLTPGHSRRPGRRSSPRTCSMMSAEARFVISPLAFPRPRAAWPSVKIFSVVRWTRSALIFSARSHAICHNNRSSTSNRRSVFPDTPSSSPTPAPAEPTPSATPPI